MKKNIYIIEMYSPTIPSKVIKAITKYNYTHVGISLEKNCDKVYSFGRKSINNFLNGGFVVESKNGEFYTKLNTTICQIIEIEVTQNQYTKIKKRLDFMVRHSKIYKYDFLGILLRLFNIPISFKNHYVCTQFVAEILEKNKIFNFRKDTSLIKPKDFEKIKNTKNAKIIYKGRYVNA